MYHTASDHSTQCCSAKYLLLCSAEPDEDIILAEGVGKFCDDLGVDPADIVMVSGWSSAQRQLGAWPVVQQHPGIRCVCLGCCSWKDGLGVMNTPRCTLLCVTIEHQHCHPTTLVSTCASTEARSHIDLAACTAATHHALADVANARAIHDESPPGVSWCDITSKP